MALLVSRMATSSHVLFRVVCSKNLSTRFLEIGVIVVHVIHGESPWQDWYKNLLLLHAEEFSSLHPYCVFPLFIFAKEAILTSTLRFK